MKLTKKQIIYGITIIGSVLFFIIIAVLLNSNMSKVESKKHIEDQVKENKEAQTKASEPEPNIQNNYLNSLISNSMFVLVVSVVIFTVFSTFLRFRGD